MAKVNKIFWVNKGSYLKLAYKFYSLDLLAGISFYLKFIKIDAVGIIIYLKLVNIGFRGSEFFKMAIKRIIFIK
jgi:hypothetical protein